MKEKFSKTIEDTIIKSSILLSFVFVAINGISILIFFQKFPPYIPFYNSMPWGKERFAHPNALLIFFLTFLFIIIMNNLLGIFLYKSHPLISRMLSMGAFLFVFLGFLASLQIILLVF